MEFVSFWNLLYINLLSKHMHSWDQENKYFSDYYQSKKNFNFKNRIELLLIFYHESKSIEFITNSRRQKYTFKVGEEEGWYFFLFCCCSITSCFLTNETNNNLYAPLDSFKNKLYVLRLIFFSFISFYYCCEIKHRPFLNVVGIRVYIWYGMTCVCLYIRFIWLIF